MMPAASLITSGYFAVRQKSSASLRYQNTCVSGVGMPAARSR